MSDVVTAGNKGEKVRSDCFVTLQAEASGGIRIELHSRVEALYGKDIRELAERVLIHSGFENAVLGIEDSGALPFVIAARIEAAVRQIRSDAPPFLFPVIAENRYPTFRDRFRFTRLYLPGNTPSLMLNAGIHKPDGIITDLEDSVAPAKKAEARLLVRNAICQVNFYGAERMARINQIPSGLDDLIHLVPYNVHLILVPKCEDPVQISLVDREITRISKLCGRREPVFLMPIIESALGVENAFSIAGSSPNIVAMAIGLEDYTADTGTRRTVSGEESLYARSRFVNACKAARIQPIDSVYPDTDDEEGLKKAVAISGSLGFEGMGCIHPRQINTVREGYSPLPGDIEKAKEIALAYFRAEEEGQGVVALGSKMIDAPVVKRAMRTLDLAVKLGMIRQNWREEYED